MLFQKNACAIIGLCVPIALCNVVGATSNSSLSASEGSPVLDQMLLSLPGCAIPCLESSFTKTSCAGLDDFACLCADANFQAGASQCVSQSCTVREMLTTKKTLLLLCDQPVKRDTSLVPIIWTFFGLACLAIALRLFARVVTNAYFWWDDLAAFLGFAGSAAFAVVNVESIHTGMGMDIWFVDFDDITKVLAFFYAIMLLYTTTRFFIRASIILFYLRVFPAKSDNNLGRLVVYTLIFNVVYNISFFLAVLFQCKPIPFFWHVWEGHDGGQGHCGSANALAWAAAITGIIYDFWLLALPFPQLLKLNLHWRRKLMAGAMFLVGFGVMIISFIRLKTINQFTRTVNPTKDIVDLCLWSAIELDIGVVCPCLPSFRLLIRRYFPSAAGTSAAQYEMNPTSGARSLGTAARRSAAPGVIVEKSVTQKGAYTNSRTGSSGGKSFESGKGLVDRCDEENQGSQVQLTMDPFTTTTTTTVTAGARN